MLETLRKAWWLSTAEACRGGASEGERHVGVACDVLVEYLLLVGRAAGSLNVGRGGNREC